MLETTGWMGPPTPRTFSGHGCSAEGPSKPPEKHPTPEGGGEPGSISERRNVLVGKHGAGGEEAAQGFTSPHSTHGPWLSRHPRTDPAAKSSGTSRFGAALGDQGHGSQSWGTVGARRSSPDLPLLQPAAPKERAAGSWRGDCRPPGYSSHPDTHSGLTPNRRDSLQPAPSPWGDGTPAPAPSPSPRIFPQPGDPRDHSPHTDPRCRSGDPSSLTPNEPSPHPPPHPNGSSAPQPSWERGSSRSPGR